MTIARSESTLSALFPILMCAAFLMGLWLNRRYQKTLPLQSSQKWFLALSGFCAAMLAAKLPYLIPGLPGFSHSSSLFFSSKTILFGMVGGYFGVEAAKAYLNIKIKTGDSFVVPVAVAIAIGRVACFFGGCCYGTPTQVPWGVVFSHVDLMARHPTQLYEAAFHLTAAGFAAWFIHVQILPRQLVKVYFLSYFCFRFLTEFLRPEPRVAVGLSIYQIVIAFLIPLFAWLYWYDARRAGIVPGKNNFT